MSVIVTALSGNALPVSDSRAFRELVLARWPDAQFISYVGTAMEETTDVAVDVFAADETHGRIRHSSNGLSVACDEEDFRSELAAWASEWSESVPDLFLMDDGATYVIPIRPGMTPEDAEAAIVTPDWSATPPF